MKSEYHKMHILLLLSMLALNIHCYDNCYNYKLGQGQSSVVTITLPPSTACEITVVTPITGDRSMTIKVDYTAPVQSNRYECPPGAAECDNYPVIADTYYTYIGSVLDRYQATYLFSNTELTESTFRLTISDAEGSISSQAFLI